ncbi:hypothetical protein M1446_03785 [Candidatus Dependentiae bacterium]|nr:hypothetical protein [Candidatus Dependentiae bacterium]
MFLNGTILAQAINFLFAYFLLSRFLLKFAVDVVQKEKKYLNSLYSKLKNNQNKIAQYEENKNEAWIECKKSALKLKPKIEEKIPQPEIAQPSIVEFEPTKQIKKDLSGKLKQIILKRID